MPMPPLIRFHYAITPYSHYAIITMTLYWCFSRWLPPCRYAATLFIIYVADDYCHMIHWRGAYYAIYYYEHMLLRHYLWWRYWWRKRCQRLSLKDYAAVAMPRRYAMPLSLRHYYAEMRCLLCAFARACRCHAADVCYFRYKRHMLYWADITPMVTIRHYYFSSPLRCRRRATPLAFFMLMIYYAAAIIYLSFSRPLLRWPWYHAMRRCDADDIRHTLRHLRHYFHYAARYAGWCRCLRASQLLIVLPFSFVMLFITLSAPLHLRHWKILILDMITPPPHAVEIRHADIITPRHTPPVTALDYKYYTPLFLLLLSCHCHGSPYMFMRIRCYAERRVITLMPPALRYWSKAFLRASF